jgi:trans-aconitate 2-methyltransferase
MSIQVLADISKVSSTISDLAPQATTGIWWNGKAYSENSLWQFELANEILLKFSFKGDEKVLDIGCGDGRITALIAKEKVPRGTVLGIDMSSSMIQTALEKSKNEKNVIFQEGLAESFHIYESFDVIVSFSTLHWVVDQKAAWENIRRHLKIGGHALVSLNPPPRNKELAEAIVNVMQSSIFSPFFSKFVEKSIMPELSLDEYKEVVIGTGLRVDHCTQYSRNLTFESKAAFVNNVKSWLPHVAQVPIELQYQFVDEIITHFLKNSHQDNSGQVTLKYTNFIVKAERIS